MTTQLTIQDRVYSVEKEFNQVNSYKLNFIKEAQFALQLLQGSDFLQKSAQQNPAALEYAIINLASIGISLNPALKEAYLVPRGGKICLDISYMGLVKLATDTGSIVWVQSEIVKAKDEFIYNGVGQAPTHKMNPFGDRGEMVGVYCVAKLSTGEFLSTMMSVQEVKDIRDKSSQASKNGPWVTFFEEMAKKSVVKRASKLWPKSERVQQAVQVINEHEGIEFNSNGAYVPNHSGEIPTENDFAQLRERLTVVRKSEKALIDSLRPQFPSIPESIDEFNSAQLAVARDRVEGLIKKITEAAL